MTEPRQLWIPQVFATTTLYEAVCLMNVDVLLQANNNEMKLFQLYASWLNRLKYTILMLRGLIQLLLFFAVASPAVGHRGACPFQFAYKYTTTGRLQAVPTRGNFNYSFNLAFSQMLLHCYSAIVLFASVYCRYLCFVISNYVSLRMLVFEIQDWWWNAQYCFHRYIV